MSESRQTGNTEQPAEFPVAKIRESPPVWRSLFTQQTGIWWFGGIALVIAVVLVVVATAGRGPQIVVTFADGHGLKAGDRLQHRGLDVGEVTAVELNSGLDGVVVELTLEPKAAGLARQGSQFWIERPQISISRISGLETVVGARFVGVLPGPAEGIAQTQFEGLDTPPLLREADAAEIRVRFSDGRGLAVGDSVKHRGIVIGEVTSVELESGFEGVEIGVRLVGDAAGVARSGTKFWIERPRLSVGEVRGLDTIVAGRYLAVMPGPADAALEQSFVGLESAPAGELPEGGLEIVLQAAEREGLQAGAPVMYRGQRVGHVVSVGLAGDAASVDARVYVESAYRSLVRTQSQFWIHSGIDVDVGLRGVQVSTESLSSVAIGGVSFATPQQPGEEVITGHVFVLHAKPEREWQQWQPRIALGDALLPEGLARPVQLRATLTWKEKRFGIRRNRSRSGWLLPLQSGAVLGPADLLTPPEPALDEFAQLELSGHQFSLSPGKAALYGELAVFMPDDDVAGSDGWQKTLTRVPAKPEDVILSADPQMAPIPLPAERFKLEGSRWSIDPSVNIDPDWHGGGVISATDGKLLGILIVTEEAALVSPLTADVTLIQPSGD